MSSSDQVMGKIKISSSGGGRGKSRCKRCSKMASCSHQLIGGGVLGVDLLVCGQCSADRDASAVELGLGLEAIVQRSMKEFRIQVGLRNAV